LLLLIVATSFSLFAQDPIEENDEIDQILDELFFNEQQLIDDVLELSKTNPILYANTVFGSNTFLLGRDAEIDQYNIVPQLSFFAPSGLNFSISGLFYQKYSPNWDFTSVSLGYYNWLDKNKFLNYYLGYSKLFYSDGSQLFTNSLDLNLGIKNKKHTLSTSISATYLFGNDQALQLSSSTYGKITIIEQKNFAIKFVPQVNFIVSKQTMAFTVENQLDETIIEYNEYEIFDIINTQVNLPLRFVTKSWDFDVSYNLNFPNAVAIESNLKNTGFFSLSVGYLINLKSKK
jgi:hypothetical protein